MRLFIYEHISSAGLFGQEPSLLCEGFAMLARLALDFKRAGFEVFTMLDHRIRTKLPVNVAIIKDLDDYYRVFEKLCKETDFTYIIAPEEDNLLKDLVERAQNHGAELLNCRQSFIEITSFKDRLYAVLEKLGIRYPKSKRCSGELEELPSDFQYPVIVKPVDGVGCSGVFLVNNKEELKVATHYQQKDYLVQEYLRGVPISANILSNGVEIKALSINRQYVSLRRAPESSEYTGGLVPYRHKLEDEIKALLRKLFENLEGHRGWVGADLLISRKKLYVIELNPRLTTSYIGLSYILNKNPAHLIYNSVCLKKLPKNIAYLGVCLFSKNTKRKFKKRRVLSFSLPCTFDNKSYKITVYISKCASELRV